MKQLTPMLVTEIAAHLTGKRRQKFLDSVNVINVSLAQEGWTPRGSSKAHSGFGQGLATLKGPTPRDEFELYMCVQYGQGNRLKEVPSDEQITKLYPKVPLSVVRAWIELCVEKHNAFELLNAARPVPVITAIGLSPKVTATLTECGLDLDLPSIRMAKIEHYDQPAFNDDGTPKFHKNGERAMDRIYYVAWSEGIKHMRSRFAVAGGCEACGKRIPSRLFVPIEATCKKQGLISMWLGCDCARNIFGVKDVGLDKNAKPPAGGAK